jgi:hypothetical protein
MSSIDRREVRSRRWRRGALAGGAALAALAAVWLVGGGLDGARGSADTESARSGRLLAARHLRTRGPAGEVGASEPATCWAGLGRFDAEVSLERFRAWAAPLLASGDDLVREYLVERLAELIGDDEGRAREVLAWAGAAGGDELWLLLDAVKRTEAVHLPAVAGELVRLAFAPDADPERRAAFLAALDSQRHLGGDVLDGMASLALVDEPGEAGWVAARTVGRVMAHEVGRGGDAEPYLERLLTVGARSPDAQVRSVALEMPMHADVLVEGEAASRLAAIVASDPDPDVRRTAIHDLSLARDRDQALALYEELFRAEHDRCVRWAVFRFTARTAGARALPVMKRMAAIDPRFQDDYLVFERIYASGVVDFERVWHGLPDDDPHHCLLHEEEGEDHE